MRSKKKPREPQKELEEVLEKAELLLSERGVSQLRLIGVEGDVRVAKVEVSLRGGSSKMVVKFLLSPFDSQTSGCDGVWTAEAVAIAITDKLGAAKEERQ